MDGRIASLFLGGLLLATSACQFAPAGAGEETGSVPSSATVAKVAPGPQDVSATATAPAAADTAAAAAAPEEKTGFHYSYPADLATRYPTLARHLEDHKAKTKAGFDKMIAEYPKDAGPAANQLSSTTEWRIDGDTAGALVLLAEASDYQGGAHGMHWTDVIIWDKKADKSIEFLDLFTDPVQAQAKIMPAYCAMLDAERLGMRGEPTPKGDLFGDCPDPFEAVVYPAVVHNGAFTRIGISLPPYTAGPYVEGQYNFTIAAPAFVTDLVKPEYKALFQTYM